MDAVALALIVNAGMPSNPAKKVLVGAASRTTTALWGAQPPNETTHFVVTVVVTPLMLDRLFLLPSDELYWRATRAAWVALGSS